MHVRLPLSAYLLIMCGQRHGNWKRRFRCDEDSSFEVHLAAQKRALEGDPPAPAMQSPECSELSGCEQHCSCGRVTWQEPLPGLLSSQRSSCRTPMTRAVTTCDPVSAAQISGSCQILRQGQHLARLKYFGNQIRPALQDIPCTCHMHSC